MNQFIALEGLSGVGKTTVGKILAKKINGIFYKTPPAGFTVMREQIDRQDDQLKRFLFYLSGIVLASKEIEEFLKSKPVVCDRYILTTLCWHKIRGVDISKIETFLSNNYLIRIPDFTFLIVCEEMERLRRLKIRGLSFNDKVERDNKLEDALLTEYKKHYPIEIDNTIKNPLDATKRIINFLG